jgi:hypothetical protein
VIAGGDGTRWDAYLGVPKHLAPVLGEPIIHRTQRLLAMAGVHDVRVISTDARFPRHGGVLEPPVGYESAGGGVKKFLDSSHAWNPEGRTLVLYGDVFFTEDAIREIVLGEPADWTLYCRFADSRYTGCVHPECFAQSFLPHHHAEHLRALQDVARWFAAGSLKRAGGWEHYRRMLGYPIQQMGRGLRRDPGRRRVVIDDWTDDFDRPSDYEEFVRRYADWRREHCLS